MSAQPLVRPFPHDFAVRITEGAIVYFCYQAMTIDPATGEYVCVLSKTKDACLNGLISLGVPKERVNDALVQQVALVPPNAIRTRSGGMAALEPNPPIKRKSTIPKVVIDILDADDLI